jgi:glycosyltransferase involved in cell wall biosynthesis
MFNSECSRVQHDRAGFCMKDALVTHNGIDVPGEVDIAHWRRDIRAQIGVDDDAIVFMHVGRAHSDKGIGNFVKASQIVHAQLGARAIFVRVGKPGWETAQSSADIALERSPLLYHAGEQLDARPWLAAADVCAMTSLRESCPNVVLEAMSVGTPVVATDVGDAALLVGECGWVVQPNSPGAIAKAMIAAASAIAQSSVRAHLSAEARTVMASRHSRDEVAQKQIAIYRGVIASPWGAEQRAVRR